MKVRPKPIAVPKEKSTLRQDAGQRLLLEALEERLAPSIVAMYPDLSKPPGVAAQRLAAAPATTAPDFEMMGGEGFNNLKVASDGTVAQLLWRDNGPAAFPRDPISYQSQLIYRTLVPGGTWHEEIVTSTYLGNSTSLSGPYDGRVLFPGFVADRPAFQAQLLFRSDSTPDVFAFDFAAPERVDHFRRSASGVWQAVEAITTPVATRYPAPVHLVAACGRDDSFHLLVTGTLSSGWGLFYGTNRGGTWSFQTVTSIGDPTGYFQQEYAPRFVSLAIDSQGFAHATYTPEFVNTQNANGTLNPFSQLAYATNRSGTWTTQVVYQAADGSGDAGLGASVAIGPSDQVAIASFFDKRSPSGSPQYSELLYHVKRPDGSWSTEVVANAPDGYVAGDGAHFTGFAPQLAFDAQGQPNIVFSDHASQHFPTTGADEFAGQIRHAVEAAGQWILDTVYRQTDPVHNEVEYPTMALSSGGPIYAAEVRTNTTDPNTDQIVSEGFSLIELLGNAGTDIRMLTATQTDARDLRVQYSVTGRPVPSFQVGVYRLSTPTVTSTDTPLETGTVTVTGSSGIQTASIALSSKLGIDPTHRFVVLVADPNDLIYDPDRSNNAAYFEKHVLGVIVHGLQPELTFSVPAWETAMDAALTQKGYDDVIPFNWSTESKLPIPGVATAEAQNLASAIIQHADGLVIGHPADVVDLQIIGHSRGAGISALALHDLTLDPGLAPELRKGFKELTLLDPHPASNDVALEDQASIIPSLLAPALSDFVTEGLSRFQRLARDPSVTIPANVDQAEVYFQHTPYSSLSASMASWEHVLNLWGVLPAGAYASKDLTGLVGHSEVPDWYIRNVLNHAPRAMALAGSGQSPMAPLVINDSTSDPDTAFLYPAYVSSAGAATAIVSAIKHVNSAYGGENSPLTVSSLNLLSQILQNESSQVDPAVERFLVGLTSDLRRSLEEDTTSMIAAPTPTVLFVIRADGSVWKDDLAAGWAQIGGAGTVRSVSAVKDSSGESAAFVVTSDDALALYQRGRWMLLGAPGTIESISAGTDSKGAADVFVITADASLTEWSSSSGWLPAPIGGAGSILSAIALSGDAVAVITADRSVYEHNNRFGWFAFTSAHFAQSVAAVADPTGGIALFVQTTANGLYRYDSATGWAKLGGDGTIQAISSGTDVNGHADVVVITTGRALFENESGAGWVTLSPPAAAVSIVGARGGRLFAILDDGSLFGHDDALGFFPLAGPGFVL